MNEQDQTNLNDAELVALAQSGDQEAYGQLYARYVRRIYRYLRSRVQRLQDAEDLTEQVFLQAYQSLARYEERGHPYSAFLYQVARNQLADHYRKQREEVGLSQATELQASNKPMDQHLSDQEQLGALGEAFEGLREDYQEVIRLRILLELTTKEAASWLERSEGATRVLLYRALKAMREQLGNDDEEE